MNFNYQIVNPPYVSGLCEKIVLTSLPTADISVVLMPFSYYRKSLYKNVTSFELSDPRSIKDATISSNLCICSLVQDEVGKFEWRELQLMSFEPKYREFYEWNIKNDRGYVCERKDGIPYEELNVETDFVETARCSAEKGNCGFGGESIGFKFNVPRDGYQNPWLGNVMYIRFRSRLEKDNFCKYWYYGLKRKRLCSKTILGLHTDMLGKPYSMFIPQIDWEKVQESPFWEKGEYDNAVLDVMGLDLGLALI